MFWRRNNPITYFETFSQPLWFLLAMVASNSSWIAKFDYIIGVKHKKKGGIMGLYTPA